MSKLTITYVKIDELKPFDKNPRKNTKAIERVKKSIKANGFNQPIVTDKEKTICVGHTRFYAAKELGLKEVPVYIKKMTYEQFLAYNMADNKTSELAEWDNDLLSELMQELADAEHDLEATGFDEDEVDALLDDSDLDDLITDTPPPKASPATGEGKAHVKMVQIFLDDTTFPLFIERCEAIQERLETNNLTDTVYKAIEKIHNDLKVK